MKRIYTLLGFVILLTINGLSQSQHYTGMISQDDDGTYFYMRSSLEMVYIDSDYFPNKELVDNSWNDYMDPQKNFPNQYNKHGAEIGVVPLGGNSKVSDAEMAKLILTYINRNKVANKLLMRWFNYNKDGKIPYDVDYPENPEAMINMQTIFDRGYYTVNAGDENLSMSALKRDRDIQIKELSMKLIPFTFMTFTKFEFYENEPVARAVRDAAYITAETAYNQAVKNGTPDKTAAFWYNIAIAAANTVYNSTKDGYTLKSNTWLYKLVWDEKTENYFNNKVLENPELLETSDMFKMEYVDCQDNKSTVIISATRSFEQIINLTMVRNLNKVFLELQERNDVFKVWTPLLDFYSLVSPRLEAPITVNGKVITAKIGTKEGLRGGEQFSVYDEDGNFYGYAIAQKGMVWDNGDELDGDAQMFYEPQVDKKGNPVTCTTFKGKGLKNARTGLLLSNPMPPKKTRIAARIGTKEGVEDNDKYIVYQYDAEKSSLKKVGSVKVIKGKVWDNYYYNVNDMNRKLQGQKADIPLKKRDKEGLRITETQFKGSCKVQPGMFLRKEK